MVEMITLSQQVTNRELAILGQTEIEQVVRRAFAYQILDEILEKLELVSEVVEVAPRVDPTLPPFRFSEQYGVRYSVSILVMTPEELEAHNQQMCEACDFDQRAYEALTEDESMMGSC